MTNCLEDVSTVKSHTKSHRLALSRGLGGPAYFRKVLDMAGLELVLK